MDGCVDEEHALTGFRYLSVQMQLTAVGLQRELRKASCCGLPLTLGGLMICGVMIIRGMIEVCEGRGSCQVILARGPNPYWQLAHSLFSIEGWGDLIIGTIAVLATVVRLPLMLLLMPLWLAIRLVIGAVLGLIVVTYDSSDIGDGWAFILALGLTLADIYFLVISVQMLMLVTLRAHIAPSTIRVLSLAQQDAAYRKHRFCSRSHVLMGLLSDEESCALIAASGGDVAQMKSLIGQGSIPNQAMLTEWPSLGQDAELLVRDAAIMQYAAGDRLLTADHLILALFRHGAISLGARATTHVVDIRVIRRHIRLSGAARMAEMPKTWAPHVCGLFPLEDMVELYLVVQTGFCFILLFRLITARKSLEIQFAGVKHVRELETLTFVMSLFGFLLGMLGVMGIQGHWWARERVYEKATMMTGRQDLELDEAFDAVREEGEALHWLGALKRGAEFTGILLVWSIAELFLCLPFVAMFLIDGDLCGLYTHGVTQVAAVRPWSSSLPMQCRFSDTVVTACVLAFLSLKLYMSWALFTLWHQYSKGWTTTDPRGLGYMDPIPIGQASASMIRMLAGVKSYHPSEGEARPLLL